MAARSGYDWTYRGVPLWDGEAIVFYRYRDVEQARATGNAAFVATGRRAQATEWVVDPTRHETLLDVLEGLGRGRGLVGGVEERGAATPSGPEPPSGAGFLEAVDLLLAAPATRRSLVALAHEPNRHLVVDDAEAVR